MSNYNWTDDHIMDRNDYLWYLFYHDQSIKGDDRHKLISDLKHLKTYLENRNYDLSKLGMLDKYYYATNQIDDVDFLWDELQDFDRNHRDDIETVPLQHCSLSKEDLITLTHDFFRNNFDSYFYGNFIKNFYRRRDHIAFNHDDKPGVKGELFSLKSTKESFIRVYRDFTYNDLLTIIHEYMHATSFSINDDHFHKDKDYYSEIDPILAELLACDYFEKQFGDHKIDAVKLFINDYYCQHAKFNAKLIDLYKKEKANGKFRDNKALRQAATEAGITNLDKELNSLNIKAAINYMFAIEFYSMYKQDKERALNSLKKFILASCEHEIDYYKELKKLGILPNMNAWDHHLETVELSRKLKIHQ